MEHREKNMRCPRCNGSVISQEIGDPGNYRPGWHCISCGKEGEEMAAVELTEEQRREKQRQWAKNYRDNLTPERREEIAKAGRENAKKRYLARKQATGKGNPPRPPAKAGKVVPVAAQKEERVFLPAALIVGAATTIKLELIYELKSAQILKE